MDILSEINNNKKEEVFKRKKNVSIKELEESEFFERKCFSATESISKGSGIIAEYKRKSPSKGIINDKLEVEEVSEAYVKAGVSALSILTDYNYFGGKNEYLTRARTINNIPILRKDFVVDEYQIIEAKSIGADFILLIAASLSKQQIKNFSSLAKSLGLEVLLELHDKNEINKISYNVDITGVNNRDLKTFKVDINKSVELVDIIPNEFIKISESGLSNPEDIKKLRKVGYKGFLMGERFMKTDDPGTSCREFIVKAGLL